MRLVPPSGLGQNLEDCLIKVKHIIEGHKNKYPAYSLVAPMVKNLPAIWETWVQSLGWEDPLEKGVATHHSILAWRIPRTDDLAG